MDKHGTPLVSVICLCYNHSEYVVEALNSVINQTYPRVEIIIVNDASTDASDKVITDFLVDHPHINYLSLKENVGNCRAFNLGWQASKGEYVIDLAADDKLLVGSIDTAVEKFSEKGNEYGVHFGDAKIIDREGELISEHITKDLLEEAVPEGYIFKELLAKYFLNPATMMYSRELLSSLGGYDETLAYEDFDLWVRSAKKFKYCYSNEFLVEKRELRDSHGRSQYKPGSKILKSTYLVCEKAFHLCDTEEDYQSLIKRINYEMKMAFFTINWLLAANFYKLRKRVMTKISAPKF
jgi:glycosyltransferase involved in cell wall biosynthesis